MANKSNCMRCCEKMEPILQYGEDEHAELYAKFRPTYTDDIYRTFYEFCEKDKSFDYGLAVDVGCGSGQSTLPLCKKFRQVIGCDISPAQIKYAKEGFDHLTYEICAGQNMSFLEDSSVDLVTLGNALHWLDQEAFYNEVDRVLKPGGVMAAYGYASLHVDKEQGHLAYKHFWDNIAHHGQEAQFSCSSHSEDVILPFTEQQRFDQGVLDMMTSSSVDHFVGLLSSLQAYRDLCMDKPENTLLVDTRNILREIYGNDHVKIRWQIYMLVGRKPVL